MSERHVSKHASLYDKFNFSVIQVVPRFKELATPKISSKRGKDLTEMLQYSNQPVVVRSISASFFTMIYMFENMDKKWREENIKAQLF